VTDAPIEIAGVREAAPPLRRAWFADPRLRRLGSGLVGATFWLLFAYANIRSSIESHRVIGLGVGILGVWAAALFIVRRQPAQVSRSLPVWAIAYAGTFGASLLRPGGGGSGWSDAVGLSVQCVAVLLGAFGYSALGRSFGLVPAHRGLVTSGVYRLVRHPLYSSYVVADVGYLIQSPSAWNVGVLLAVWTCQVLRLLSEERLLARDPGYRAYCERTRWRLVPGLW
jgi:protein-S-isoprenylcysteine O-methyltransferase Ste14